ncbi:MAG TPA: (2Fe-2S)-binding protein [Sediminispirochaeta sp.]|nr:(2Fe-2S)-binding protein [Sediminispirochaeta sp.]
MTKITFSVNGESRTIETDPLRRLLDVLREDLGLTGVKEGCAEGECGACSVIKDGLLVNSCMVPIGTCEGARIVTPEGLRETDRGRTIIDAYADSGAVQCGFCTPGMMMATEALLEKNSQPSEAEAREALSGNLCRCTGYDMIVEGVLKAAERGKGLW